MDTVRFGRVLGFGARQAAKTVISAVDAARAENPSPPAARPVAPAGPVASISVASTVPAQPRNVAATPVPAVKRDATPGAPIGSQVRGVQEGISRFKASAVEPVVRLSSVLWLEVMGVLFGIFALSTAAAVWRQRGDWRPALAHPAAHGGLLVAAAIFLLFGYFSTSSFVRARRRERRRS